MHIGLYAPGAPESGSANGIVTYTRIIREALRALGHRVSVVSPLQTDHADGRITPHFQGGLANRVDGLLQRFERPGEHPLHRHRRLARIVRGLHRSEPLDVFEMEESFGWAAHLRLPIPTVVRLHGPHFYGKDRDQPPQREAASQRRIVAEREALVRAAAVTSPSARLLQATLSFYDLDRGNVATIPNPMPLSAERWSAAQADRRQILFVGRFDLCKGADIVLRAFSDVAAIQPDIRLVMAGPDEGIVERDGNVTRFEAFATANIPSEIRARIRFLGPISPDEVRRLRLQSAINISCSRSETFSYSIAEAMTLGAPSIVSDTSGVPEFLIDRVSALIVPAGDVHATAQAIGNAVASPDRAAAMGEQARRVCQQMLDPAAIAQRTVDLYHSLSIDESLAV